MWARKRYVIWGMCAPFFAYYAIYVTLRGREYFLRALPERLPESSEAFVYAAMTRLMVRRLARA
jgi:hypothetical protein